MSIRNIFLARQFIRVMMVLVLVVGVMAAGMLAEERSAGSQDVYQRGSGNNYIAPGVNLIDCPAALEDSAEYRLVLQIIDNTFHKWREYDSKDEGGFCIFMEEPERRALSAEEASALLIASKGWLTQVCSVEAATAAAQEGLAHQARSVSSMDEPHAGRRDGYCAGHPYPLYPSALACSSPVSAAEIEMTQQGVIGSDERVRVAYAACTAYPANTVGYVEVDYGSLARRSTGFLIGPHTVLTTAHNIYNSDFGGWFSTISFHPGQYQAHEGDPVVLPYGKREAVDAKISATYLDYEDKGWERIPYDYGAFFIETPFHGISTFMPLEFNAYPSQIHLLGYPVAVQEEAYSMAMWQSSGLVTAVKEREIEYLADASYGTSGAPVYINNQQTDMSRVVGLLAASIVSAEPSSSFNTGPRLTDHNKAAIQEWMLWEPEDTNVPVTSVSLDKSSMSLAQGESEILTATVFPFNATHKAVSWSSSSVAVATVSSNGLVTAVGPGTATITVTTADGHKTAVCIVEVAGVVEPVEVELIMVVDQTTYTTDGVIGTMDVAPFIENDRTFVPVSFIAAEFGLNADWGPRDTLTQWVTFESDDISIEIEIDSNVITVTEAGIKRTVNSDVAAQIVNDRTYLPIRAVGEILGATFDWGPKDSLTEWVSFSYWK